MRFRDLLVAAQNKNNSTLAVGLAPSLLTMPEPVTRYDDPYLPFGKLVIDTTGELVCAYVFYLGAYLSAGASGAVALERTIAYVPASIIKILHGPFTGSEYVTAAFEDGFGADAVTLTPHNLSAEIRPYLEHDTHAVFIDDPTEVANQPSTTQLYLDYPDQFGFYQSKGANFLGFGLFPNPAPLIYAYRGPTIFPSRGTDFCDALYAAASRLRARSGS